MTTDRRPLAASLTLIAALICAGCTQSSASPVETTTTALPPPPPKTSAPPELTPEQQNQKDAEQAVVNLIDVANTVGTNSDEPLEQLATVARGDSLTFWRESTFRQRAVQESQVGDIEVVTSAATTESDNVYNVPACLDVQKVNVVDADGKSTITPDRLRKSGYIYQVENTPDGFFVTHEKATGPC